MTFSHASCVSVLAGYVTQKQQCLKESRKGRWIERRKRWLWVLTNGLKYKKKWGILDKKDNINKGRVAEIGSMWECGGVWNYVEAILTGTKRLPYDGAGHSAEQERYFFMRGRSECES